MSREEQDYSEKRNFIRMFINAPMEYKAEGSDDWQTGYGKDLSATGISFTVTDAVDEGALLEIQLKPETDVTPPLEATVKVIRCEATADEGFELSTYIEKIHR